MSAKKLARTLALALLPPVLVNVVRWLKTLKAPVHKEQGLPVAWSPGYHEYKIQLLGKLLADASLLAAFRLGRPLPQGFGFGIDERVVEYPWVMSRLLPGNERVLDAGSIFNYEYLLDHPIWAGKTLHLATLGPELNCFWRKSVSYLFCDLRDTPVRDGFYDTVVCISTLEHIGFDNQHFTGRPDDVQSRPDDFLVAMRELRRIIRKGGRLLLTVPFGVPRDLGLQRVFDLPRLDQAISAFGPAAANKHFYRYTSEGWHLADALECADCEYVEWVSRAWQFDRWPSPLPVEADRAAAARAVACIELTV